MESIDTQPDWLCPSGKQTRLENVLLERNEGKVREALELLLRDDEIHAFQCYGNVVSVRRLGYNDHGPVHARIVAYNALKIMRLLHAGGVQTSLEAEGVGTFEDSCVAVALAAFLHDVGMSVTREAHEWHSIGFADACIQRTLAALYDARDPRRVVLRALAHEGIVGHMAHDRIHSVEAGAVLVADGTDMAAGRSRIPQLIGGDPVVGDIHRYSASAIARVEITTGDTRPVRVLVRMENVTGLFQVEEILMRKVMASPVKPYVEVAAQTGDDPVRYYQR